MSVLNPVASEKSTWEDISGFRHPGWGGVLPYINYIGLCSPEGYGFSAILVINWVSILAILHFSFHFIVFL